MPPFLALKEYLDNAALSTMRFSGMVSRFAASPSLKLRLTPFLKDALPLLPMVIEEYKAIMAMKRWFIPENLFAGRSGGT